MRQVSVLWVMGFCACAAGPVGARSAPINAVSGDESWIAIHGERPSGADENERITTHLRWVHSELRESSSRDWSEAQSDARLTMLDELAAYTNAQEFPHQDVGLSERRPRFIDGEGRHCAVAHLIAVSGAESLIAAVQAEHEFDYLADMHVDGLSAWATQHGLTVRELAMIQPTYHPEPDPNVLPHDPRTDAPQQRQPFTNAVAQSIARGFADRPHRLATCIGERTGTWQLGTRVTVSRSRTRTFVRAVAADGSRDRAFETCLNRLLRRETDRVTERGDYRVRRVARGSHTRELTVYTHEEAISSFLAPRPWHREPSRQATLAQCMAGSEDMHVPVRVRAWNGHALIRWEELGGREHGDPRMVCIERAVSEGHVVEHGVVDYLFTVIISADGTWSIVPDPLDSANATPSNAGVTHDGASRLE